MGDEMTWAMSTDDIDLEFLVLPVRVGHESAIVQTQTGIMGAGSGQRDRDLRPIGIDMAPEDGAPFLVQIFQGLIAFLSTTYGTQSGRCCNNNDRQTRYQFASRSLPDYLCNAQPFD